MKEAIFLSGQIIDKYWENPTDQPRICPGMSKLCIEDLQTGRYMEAELFEAHCKEIKAQAHQTRVRYNKENKEKFAEYARIRYLKNKDKLAEKITCECGSIISRGSKSSHIKSLKHKSSSH
tara:strand:- start:314 stop:676 length:363 start_codon:yes stop_codon:yes gene_type:complete